MNSENGREVIVFTEALHAPPEEREAFLTESCAGDATLRRKVEELLAINGRLGDFLEDTPLGQVDKQEPTQTVGEKPGDWIGHYKLLQQIGEGGCGVVYMAEQGEPVRRLVALKIIKPGMDTRTVIARFEVERQALALMDHPNIAKVYDAGANASGRPYIVMELVRGVKITQYCDKNSLTTRERLELFVRVCQAVQYAHQKGIIHRDIKPSNVLVTMLADGSPSPVIIDFGIAKATTNQRLTDKTLFTAFEMLIGTPAYMSPEQAAMAAVDVDTRSDIYSLGVLLYELLTGAPPFDAGELLKKSVDEIRHVICDQDPLRPSTRLHKMVEADLTTVAKRHRSEPRALFRTVSGDLDWIVMKALEKDRQRRYETANDLARDVQRFLALEAISARPPSKLYRFQKTVSRNKLLFLGLGAIAALLIVSLIVVSASLAEARRAYKNSATALQQSRQVTGFLERMLKGVKPSVARGRDTIMLREILDQTADDLGKGMTDQPAVEAVLRNLIGELYFVIGNYDKAERMHRGAMPINRRLYGAKSAESAATLHELGLVLFREGKLLEAERMETEALGIRRQLFGVSSAEVAASLDNLACVYTDQRRFSEAEKLSREALGIRRKLFPKESEEVADSLHTLCVILGDEDKRGESQALADEALAIQKKLTKGGDTSVASALFDAAWASFYNGKKDAGEALALECLKIQRPLLGVEHPDVARTVSFLGQMMGDRGQLTTAETVLSAVYEMQCKLEGPEGPYTLYTLEAFGWTLEAEGKWTEAETIFRKSLASWRKREGNGGHRALSDLNGLVRALAAQKKFNDAKQCLDEVLTPSFSRNPACADTLWQRIDLLGRQGKWEDATADAKLLVEYQPSNHYPSHALSALLVMTHKEPAYEQLCQNILPRFTNTSEAYIAERVASDLLLSDHARIDLDVAHKLATTAVTVGKEDWAVGYLQACKALSEYRQGHFAEAARWSERSVKSTQVFASAKGWAVLAMARWQLGEQEAARAALSAGNKLAPALSAAETVDLGDMWLAWLFARISLDEATALLGALPGANAPAGMIEPAKP